jgi:hypothetical protein
VNSIEKEKLMRALTTTAAIGSAMLCAAVLAPGAYAQSSNEARELTILTVSEPMRLPGMTLPAGKYRFEIADPVMSTHVVRISNEDGTKVIGTFPTIAATMATRGLRDTDTLILWNERPAGQPQALREWYYPQRASGEEFIYPKDEALQIAAANHASVPTQENGKVVRVGGDEQNAANAPAATTSAPANQNARNTTATAPVSVGTSGQGTASTPSNTSTRSTSAQNTSAQNNTSRSNTAPSNTSAQQSDTANQGDSSSRRTLPRTASQLSLFELLSALAIAGAFGVRYMRVRLAARS